EVFGGEMSDTCEFTSLDEANEILGLMMRHWNDIAGTLFKGEVYVPLLLEDDGGTVHGDVLQLSGLLAGDVKESRNDNPTRDLQMAADRIRPHTLCGPVVSSLFSVSARC